jgi:hypothetical protein
MRDHPAQPLAPDHTPASFLIAASPDAAPEESRWSPRSRAAASRNDLDADQRQSTIRRRARTRTTNALPRRRSSADAIHTSFNHRGTIAGSLCCDHRQNPPNLYRRSLTPAAGGYRYRVISAEEPTAAVAAPLRHLDRLTRNPAAGFAAGATVGLLGGLIGLGGAEFRLPLLIALYQSTVRPSRGSGPPLANEVA